MPRVNTAAFFGVNVNPDTAGAPTDAVIAPETPFKLAVIVAFPAAMPVKTPVGPTTATVGLAELHATVDVTSLVCPAELVLVAWSCVVVPALIAELSAVTRIDPTIVVPVTGCEPHPQASMAIKNNTAKRKYEGE